MEKGASVGFDRGTSLMQPARRRQLAGDGRAGVYARGIARRRQHAFMRENWLGFAVTGVVSLAVLLAAAYFVPSDFGRGMLVGGGLVAVASALWNWTVQASGTAPSMMGELGEQWTARELRKLRRHGWRVINHVTLKTRDIDHVLIGPGGVIAVETKWTAKPWTWDPIDQRIVEAARIARAHAHDLGLWRELKRLCVGDVSSVTFLWGDGARGIAPGAELDGTSIVTGRTVDQWRSGLDRDRLTPAQVEAAWQAVDAQCRLRDPLEAETAPVPLSLSEWLARVVFALVAACAGFLAVTTVAGTGLTWILSLTWWVLMLAVGVAVSRIAAVRYLGLAWAGGVITVGLAAAVALLAWIVG